MLRHWPRLCTEDVHAPSLRTSKARWQQDSEQRALLEDCSSCNKMIFSVPSKPDHSGIATLYDPRCPLHGDPGLLSIVMSRSAFTLELPASSKEDNTTIRPCAYTPVTLLGPCSATPNTSERSLVPAFCHSSLQDAHIGPQEGKVPFHANGHQLSASVGMLWDRDATPRSCDICRFPETKRKRWRWI